MPPINRPMLPSRRRFVEGLAATGVLGAVGWPGSSAGAAVGGSTTLSGTRFDLTISTMPVNITGHSRTATAVNNSVPAPVLRFREGETVTIHVANRLDEPTSIHWHGLLLPNAMDGVPGLTFKGIMPGETFTYQFPVIQGGTYWYHSHSGMQEQTGLYGPLILEPAKKDPFSYDRDYVVMLSDWTDEDPMAIVSNLKQQSDYYNYGRRTLGTFIADVKRDGFGATIRDRLMWGDMRMTPTDIMDVTGATYTFLINGLPPAAHWTGLFERGERVRLRFINGSSMSTFDVRIPGLKLTVVQADGTNVQPVTVEEFRIGVAETFDVLVSPTADAYTIFAQAQDRSGFARATLATRAGATAPVPAMDPRPLRPMADMGMGATHDMSAMEMSHGQSLPQAKTDHGDHGSMQHAMPGMDMKAGAQATAPAGAPMPQVNGDHANHGDAQSGAQDLEMDMTGNAGIPSQNADGVDPNSLQNHPSVDNVAMSPSDRQGEAGTGLDGNGRQVLTYTQLAALGPNEERPPTRELQFHLTGNMERWTWGFDGKRFSEAQPIPVKLGERVRFLLINDTMMEHPIHLHGFLFQVENGQSAMPYKHTINVKPGERVGILFTAHTAGHWAFHCHLLYHMEMGMFRTVVVA